METELGVCGIARRLGRHRVTIHRKMGRNRCVNSYRPDSADRRAWAPQLRGSRIKRSTRPRANVEDRLAMERSPEQKMEPEEVEHRVSAKSTYRHAYNTAGRRADLQ